MLRTHPDIAFATTAILKYSMTAAEAHWRAVKHIFHYLKGPRDYWLMFGENGKILEGFVNADGSMAEDRHAITGYAFLLNGGAVS